MRVAWFKDLGGVPFDPRVRAVVDAHRKTFESLGCIVDQAEPDFAPAEVAFRVLRAWNTANSYGERFRAHPEAFKDTLTGEIEEGLRLTGADVARAEAAHGQIWRRFQAFLEKYEYFVLPTTQLPPFDVNTPYPTEIAGVEIRQLHRLDEVLLVYLGDRESGGLSAGRLHAGRTSRWHADRRPRQGGLQRPAACSRIRTGDWLRQAASDHCVGIRNGVWSSVAVRTRHRRSLRVEVSLPCDRRLP